MTYYHDKNLLGLSATGFHKIAYREWGAGPRTIVCVHGLTRNGRDFDRLAADLADTLKARVICPDVVGRGQSGRLVNPDHYGYPQYLADMAALIARLEVEHVDWIGTSMGGLIGMMLAAQPNSPIRRLVINDIGPFVPKAALERIGDYVGQDPVFADLTAAEQYFRDHYAGFGQLTAEQWLHMAQHSTDRQDDGSYRLAYDPGIARIFKIAPIGDVDLWALWQVIRQPTLVIRGALSDLLLAETAERMTAEGPKAQLYTVPDAGHAPALMAPDQIAVIRDFLSRHD
ncbi:MULTISPECIES: alpha/beta fold hydrolase [unclassified Azospirillum]|uniref:alpha/beta fold hydrolase n=1 Tax=unclassified Azospirillum TaxID=2630922 RepID=UPI000B6AB233|nr:MULTISPECIES: alpha/beta hydrolase [unclassified Azospirillum]SNS36941.1 Pimeloyl-ACP methyl ester carboxylesterase [Azospirillum sp. RU38E]SNS55302.1 Pimeloyl-ACP methyl ester carboxylesterase [Azospirillum sp. RU37A]